MRVEKKRVNEQKQGKKDSAAEKEITEPIKVEPKERYIKRIDAENIMIREIPYKIIENYRDGFDVEELERRYSDFLEKYDYIVVDISDEKARLKGFYREDYFKAPADLRISSLQDYLIEYCNFGCAYYVLERTDGEKAVYISPNRKRPNRGQANRRKQTSKKPNPQAREYRNKKGRGQSKSNQSKAAFEKKAKQETKAAVESKVKRNPKPSFEKKAATDTRPVPKKEETKHVKTVKDNKGEPRFHIRKKKPEHPNK